MRPRLLFIHLHASPFVREDIRILQDSFEVVPFHFQSDPKPGVLEFAQLMLKQLAWLIREVPRSDVIYGWFADYHMLLPVLLGRLFRKPVVVTIGGFDAVSLPELNQGVVLSRWRWPLARFVLRRASLLLPVSESLVYSRNRYSEWPNVTKQGIRAFVNRLATPIKVLPTGYDPDLWRMGPVIRGPVVTTVGLIDGDRRVLIKGIDLVFDTARRMPDVTFRVVGVVDPADLRARYDVPSNVELIEPVSREDLVSQYQAASVYLQLSRVEGLPNVLCEAMLCGCIPVGSKVFGIPEAIGEAGYLIDEPDAAHVEEALRKALTAPAVRRAAARRHIQQKYSLDRRRRELTETLAKLAGDRRK